MRFVSILVALLFAGAALPAHASTANDASTTVISLQRGACLGPCPAYTVEIHSNGVVIFTGISQTAQMGEVRYSIDPADVAGLQSFISARHFNALRDKYAVNWTDQVWIQVCVTTSPAKKCVEDYSGMNAGMPQSVKDIEDEIDRVGRTAPLIKATNDGGARP